MCAIILSAHQPVTNLAKRLAVISVDNPIHTYGTDMLKGMKLLPGTRVIPLDSTAVEVRLGARPSLRFFDLSPGQHAWLLGLVGPPQSPPPIDQRPVSRRPYPQLAAALRTAGLTQPDRTPTAPGHVWDPLLTTEAAALTARELDGRTIAKQRAQTVVAVQGVSRTTIAALKTLAAGGIRYFVVHDDRVPDRLEFAHEGPEFQTAASRAAAVHSYFARTMPQCIVLSQHTAVDVVLVNFEEVINPLVTAGLQAQEIAHLITTATATQITVGPFVIPGQTGCGNCVALAQIPASQRTDFIEFSAQITTRAAQGLALPAAQSAAGAQVAGGLVGGQILAYLDGLVPALTTSLAAVDQVAPVPRLTPWQAHPQCACLAGPGGTNGDAAPAATAGAAWVLGA